MALPSFTHWHVPICILGKCHYRPSSSPGTPSVWKWCTGHAPLKFLFMILKARLLFQRYTPALEKGTSLFDTSQLSDIKQGVRWRHTTVSSSHQIRSHDLGFKLGHMYAADTAVHKIIPGIFLFLSFFVVSETGWCLS